MWKQEKRVRRTEEVTRQVTCDAQKRFVELAIDNFPTKIQDLRFNKRR